MTLPLLLVEVVKLSVRQCLADRNLHTAHGTASCSVFGIRSAFDSNIRNDHLISREIIPFCIEPAYGSIVGSIKPIASSDITVAGTDVTGRRSVGVVPPLSSGERYIEPAIYQGSPAFRRHFRHFLGFIVRKDVPCSLAHHFISRRTRVVDRFDTDRVTMVRITPCRLRSRQILSVLIQPEMRVLRTCIQDILRCQGTCGDAQRCIVGKDIAFRYPAGHGVILSV